MSSNTFVTVTGNLTADPELRYTPSGKAVAKFTVVTNERRRNAAGEWEDGDPSFHRVTAWGQLAENVAESLGKGARAIVTGVLRQRSWEDKDSGQKRYDWEVTADAVGAELSWATATVKKLTRHQGAPDDQWDTASRRRPEPAGVGGGAEPPF
ncbi:MAG TPA: single-stranded DNA-binding protein [Rugosimonospora sp.]|nr:single-stranded DNA-binding protein [Rugosimonospora sp.]